MSTSNLNRWGGLAAIVGGVLLIILDFAEFILFGNLPISEAAATGSWIIVEGLYFVAVVLITLGLVGLYAFQFHQAGTLGLVAFVITFIGGMMTAGSTWSEVFFGSWLAGAAPELMDADPSGTLVAGIILSYLLFALGWFLFGLDSLRVGVFPRGSVILVMIGAVLFLVLGILDIPFISVVFGVAITWMGYSLWSSSGEAILSPEAAM